VGAETLVRWRHPDKGLVPPGEFIRAAESSGMINRLGELVLEKAVRFIAETDCVDRIAVNVSAKQFDDAYFGDRVLAALKRYGVPPERLELEVTESVFMDDIDAVLEKMRFLKRHGIQFSIDDFGTGFSSLNYIRKIPLEYLKIDRTFIKALPHHHEDLAIVKTIADMARNLHLQTIAEGIETEEQLNTIVAIDERVIVQGYYYAKPLPGEAFLEFCKNFGG
jgi:EAL domain-containing protein (putative c-di-GMP-specific phosphodiesterase class I)